MTDPNPSTGLVRDAAGGYTAVRSTLSEDEILAAAEEIIQRRYLRTGELCSVAETKKFFRSKLVMREQEVFSAVFLDQRHRIIAYREIFFGTIDGASVHPREVVKLALHYNAGALVFSHNHPSGIAEPSQADLQITRRLREALELVDVRVLDHIVVGASDLVSLAERGLM
jgi:DNA repair protein RadC